MGTFWRDNACNFSLVPSASSPSLHAGRPQTETVTARLLVCLCLSGGGVLIWQPGPLRRARFPFPPARGLTVNLSLRDFWDVGQISRPDSAAFGKDCNTFYFVDCYDIRVVVGETI